MFAPTLIAPACRFHFLPARAKTRLMNEYCVKTTTHGRYLVRQPDLHRAPVLVGFHGYAERAEVQLDRLAAIPGAERWCLVSIQGLHRFYQPRTNDVVASWMTRQDRDLAIADNMAYVTAVLEMVTAEYRTGPPLVLAGFSQGVSMAFRAAVRATPHPAAVMAVGGDVPPELGPEALRHISAALICRGLLDTVYSAEQFARDIERLREGGVSVCRHEFGGGHEWPHEMNDAAARFLEAAERSAATMR
jgi:predicted esterase